ncbi:hypothetical protein MSPP1_002536 [Malassezia sp. CBS 17886]|nr:hypothetical protein MSPP1_002536 [Malassezia sp. CBS 17886]
MPPPASPASPASRATGSDAAYQSLRRLLASGAANAAHLDLMDRNTLYGAMGYYLSVMAQPSAREFAALLAGAPVLWDIAGGDAGQTLATRAAAVMHAAAFSVSERVALLDARVHPKPHAARREVSEWLHAVADGVVQGSEDTARPLAQVSLLSGLLMGLDAVRGEGLRMSNAQLRAAAQPLLGPWAAALTALLSDDASAGAPRTAALVVAARACDHLPAAALQLVDDRVWIQATFPALLDVFDAAHPVPVARLFADVCVEHGRVFVDPVRSACAQWAQRVHADPLYVLAGPLSRLLAGALQRAGCKQAPDVFHAHLRGASGSVPVLPRLQTLADALGSAWCASALAGADSAEIDPRSRATTQELWQAFKTFLFAATVVLDAVVDVVVEGCPSPAERYAAVAGETRGGWPAVATSNTPVPYLSVLGDVLHIYLALYWVTQTFGLDGFESYRKVFYSALDVLSRDADASTQLVGALGEAVNGAHGETLVRAHGQRAARSLSFVERTRATYVLLVTEQLVPELPEAMVDCVVLPLCRPYLEDTTYQDAFESAHAVVLALYTAQSAATLSLTPFYVHLLLRSFPTHLTATQLETALSTVVSSLSLRSDSLTWWCVEQLYMGITREGGAETRGGPRDTTPPTSDDAGASTRDVDASESAEIRRVYSLCFAALISHVNLVLLRSLLEQLQALILRLPEGSPARKELVEKTFHALADMNASTREEAMRWWLAESPQFTRGT